MRRLIWVVTVGMLGFCAASAPAAVLFNEVYPGGGSSQAVAAYHTDFIELLNTDANPVDVSGYVINYGSASQAAGNFPTLVGALPAGATIPAGGYYLVRTGAAGTGGAADPDADAIFPTNGLSASSGAIKLTDAGGTTLDIVGWGTANNFETAAATTPATIGLSLQRIPNASDTNDNLVDFQQGTPTPKAANAVPEPGSLALAAGIIIVALRRRR
ncbi:MAG TPA: lamin tail domain-containing protein [Tepidisphaeraceae bacterium]|jgi:hypothetical protein